MHARSTGVTTVLVGVLLLSTGCGGSATDGPDELASRTPSPTGQVAATTAPAEAAPTTPTMRLADATSCEQLHRTVLQQAADHGPDLDDLFPPAPYGGLGGDEAAERYDELGCSPDDEFPVLLDWLGLPPDTARDLSDGPLADAVAARTRAGDTTALIVGRRLGEGAGTTDSPLFQALRQVAAAQQGHRDQRGTYASDLRSLIDHGLDPALVADDSGLTIFVTAADGEAYCVHGADQGSAVVESHDHTPRNRIPGSPSCPNTFPDLDQ